jgi:hypothetical protein
VRQVDAGAVAGRHADVALVDDIEGGTEPRGRLGHDLEVDLGGLHDAVGFEVEPDDLAGRELLLEVDLAGIAVEHADLRGDQEQAVAGSHHAQGTEPHAVEGRDELDAVVGDEGSGAFPGAEPAHGAFVELEQGFAFRGEVAHAVFPGGGHERGDGIGEGSSFCVIGLKRAVEVCGVALPRYEGVSRPGLVELAALPNVALPLDHGVPIARDGVDFPVVADDAERLAHVPVGFRVGGEAAVEDDGSDLEGRVEQVREDARQEGPVHQALVDEGSVGAGSHVDGQGEVGERVLDAALDNEQGAGLAGSEALAAQDCLKDAGLSLACGSAEPLGHDGNGPQGDQVSAEGLTGLSQGVFDAVDRQIAGHEEGDDGADGVGEEGVGPWGKGGEGVVEESAGDVHEQAGAIAGAVGHAGATVLEVANGAEGQFQGGSAGPTGAGGDGPHAACVPVSPGGEGP